MACNLFFFKLGGAETHIHNFLPYNKMLATERSRKCVFLTSGSWRSVCRRWSSLVLCHCILSAPLLFNLRITEAGDYMLFVFPNLRYHMYHVGVVRTNPKDVCLCSQWTSVYLAIPLPFCGLDLLREQSDKLSRFFWGRQNLVYLRINTPERVSVFSVSEMRFSLQMVQVWD